MKNQLKLCQTTWLSTENGTNKKILVFPNARLLYHFALLSLKEGRESPVLKALFCVKISRKTRSSSFFAAPQTPLFSAHFIADSFPAGRRSWKLENWNWNNDPHQSSLASFWNSMMRRVLTTPWSFHSVRKITRPFMEQMSEWQGQRGEEEGEWNGN